MPSIKGPEFVLSFETVLIIIGGILGILALGVAIVKGVEAWRKISVRDRVKALETRMDNVDKRLEKGNKRFKAQSDDMGVMLMTMQGVVVHLLTGNDHEKLKATNEKLNSYMAKRATRDIENDD